MSRPRCFLLRSPNTSNVRNEYNINTSGGSNNNNTSNQYALLPDNVSYNSPPCMPWRIDSTRSKPG